MKTINMNKIRMTLYIIIVLWVAFITQLIVNQAFQNEGKIIEAFASTKSEVVESKLKLVANYGVRYMTQQDKEKLIAYFAGAIGLDNSYKISKVEGDNTTSTIGEKTGKNANTKFEIVSVASENANEIQETKQYIIITLSVYNKMDDIIRYKKILEKAVKKMDIDSFDTALQFTGTYRGNLSLQEKNQVTDELISYLQGTIVNQNRTEELFTVYAFSGIMENYLTVEGNRINVNVAITYDEEKNQTKLYLATPVINDDY